MATNLKYSMRFRIYRRSVVMTALLAFTTALFFPKIIHASNVFLIYATINILGDLLIYKILRKQDSALIPEEIMEELYKITNSGLDNYGSLMNKIRLGAYILAIFAALLPSSWKASMTCFAITYCAITFSTWMYAVFSKKVKAPFKMQIAISNKGQGLGPNLEFPFHSFPTTNYGSTNSYGAEMANPSNALGFTNPISPAYVGPNYVNPGSPSYVSSK